MKVDIYLATAGAKFWAAAYKMPLKESISRIASYGYDGIEIMPESLEKINVKELKQTVEMNGLEIVTIASGYIYVQSNLTFTHPNDEIRRKAVMETNDCIEFAHDLGLKSLPSAWSRERRNVTLLGIRLRGI